MVFFSPTEADPVLKPSLEKRALFAVLVSKDVLLDATQAGNASLAGSFAQRTEDLKGRDEREMPAGDYVDEDDPASLPYR